MIVSKLYVQLLSGSQGHRWQGKPEEGLTGVGGVGLVGTVGFLRTGLRTGTEQGRPVWQENKK